MRLFRENCKGVGKRFVVKRKIRFEPHFEESLPFRDIHKHRGLYPVGQQDGHEISDNTAKSVVIRRTPCIIPASDHSNIGVRLKMPFVEGKQEEFLNKYINNKIRDNKYNAVNIKINN